MYCSKGIILSGEVSKSAVPILCRKGIPYFQKVLHKTGGRFASGPVSAVAAGMAALVVAAAVVAAGVLLTVVMVAGGCIGADSVPASSSATRVRVALAAGVQPDTCLRQRHLAPPPMPPQIRAST